MCKPCRLCKFKETFKAKDGSNIWERGNQVDLEWYGQESLRYLSYKGITSKQKYYSNNLYQKLA